MQKADITRQVHQQTGISGTEGAKMVDWILEFMKTTLQTGEPITIHGFGKFTVRSKRPRQGRNPQTGEAVMISARRVVTFRPSLLLIQTDLEANGQKNEGWEACAHVSRPWKRRGSAEGKVSST
jgi:integration host factor subunit alpha